MITHHMSRLLILLCLLAAGLFGSAMALAHGGEDHGDEGQRLAPATTVLPRALAQSDDFELVALLDEGPSKSRRLLITLDRFKTNEPVVGAKLEVDAAGQNFSAPEQSPGVYGVQFAALSSLTPGAKLPLTILVETADGSDLLTTVLELPATAPSDIPHDHGRTEYTVWTAGAALVWVAAIVLVVCRRHFKKRDLS